MEDGIFIPLAFILMLTSVSTNTQENIEYIFNTDEATWNQAQSYCKGQGARLVTFKTKEKYSHFKNLLERLMEKNLVRKEEMWIGLYDSKPPEGSYKWTDCTSITFEKWHDGETNREGKKNCIMIQKFEWRTTNCSKKIVFACERPLELKDENLSNMVGCQKCSCTDVETLKICSNYTIHNHQFEKETPKEKNANHECPGVLVSSPIETSFQTSMTVLGSHESSFKMMTAGKDISETSFKMMTADKDIIETSFKMMTADKDIIETSFKMMRADKDISETSFKMMTAGKDIIENSFKESQVETVESSYEFDMTDTDILEFPISTTATETIESSGEVNANRTPGVPFTTEKCTCVCNTSRDGTKEETVNNKKKLPLLDPTTLSKYRRKKTSAEDKRTTAVAFGTIGVTIMVVVGLVLVLFDVVEGLTRLFRDKNRDPKAKKYR